MGALKNLLIEMENAELIAVAVKSENGYVLDDYKAVVDNPEDAWEIHKEYWDDAIDCKIITDQNEVRRLMDDYAKEANELSKDFKRTGFKFK